MPAIDIDERDLRSLIRGRLRLWGSIQRHGPLAPPRGERSGGGYESRLPVPTWCTDLTIAFAALNPTTRGLADRGDHAWLVHAPFNEIQRVIWAYYVDTDDERAVGLYDNDKAQAVALKAHDSARDGVVALTLHMDAWKVRRLRDRAIGAFSRSIDWSDDPALLRYAETA